MANSIENPNLGEVASLFLADLPPGDSGTSQQEINRFVRWFGRDRLFSGLAAAEVESYAEQLSLSDTDYVRKLELVKGFLLYARKKGWTTTNLAAHLKGRKARTKLSPSAPKKSASEAISLTRQGRLDLEAELTALRSQRQAAIEEIRRAAADKDFRENAPLHAARERRGHLEGRIMDLEGILKATVIIEEEEKTGLRASIGDSVVLCEPDSDEELCYMLVGTREADPSRGKISSVSPVGQAILGREPGEIVEITAPAGKLRYRIKRIQR